MNEGLILAKEELRRCAESLQEAKQKSHTFDFKPTTDCILDAISQLHSAVANILAQFPETE